MDIYVFPFLNPCSGEESFWKSYDCLSLISLNDLDFKYSIPYVIPMNLLPSQEILVFHHPDSLSHPGSRTEILHQAPDFGKGSCRTWKCGTHKYLRHVRGWPSCRNLLPNLSQVLQCGHDNPQTSHDLGPPRTGQSSNNTMPTLRARHWAPFQVPTIPTTQPGPSPYSPARLIISVWNDSLTWPKSDVRVQWGWLMRPVIWRENADLDA